MRITGWLGTSLVKGSPIQLYSHFADDDITAALSLNSQILTITSSAGKSSENWIGKCIAVHHSPTMWLPSSLPMGDVMPLYSALWLVACTVAVKQLLSSNRDVRPYNPPPSSLAWCSPMFTCRFPPPWPFHQAPAWYEASYLHVSVQLCPGCGWEHVLKGKTFILLPSV